MRTYLTGLLALALVACQTTDRRADVPAADTTATPATFVANPRPVAEQEVTTLSLGAAAPDFRLPGVDGEMHTLADYAGAEVLVVVFTCNHCPTAQAYEERLKAVTADYADRSVQVVAISPNSPLALLYDELGYSDLGDDYEEMVVRARDEAYNFPYLYDGDDHAVSLQYGPVATPHAFVFDRARKLRYVGRLDASEAPGTANAEDLRAAVDALLAGQAVATPQTKTFGCSTKWAWKVDYKDKVYAEWSQRPVTVEMADVADLGKLLANDTDKLRLINVWATWCGPCVLEYPEFVKMHRMYRERPFAFVSVSADKPTDRAKVVAFLEKQQSANVNYLFSSTDKYALIEAIDTAWSGALPYTVLVAPGGEVVYRHAGSIDPLEVRRAIVNHPLIGRYF